MTDKELLELAAKAAGIELEWHDTTTRGIVARKRNDYGPNAIWNPLTDDGDALRLAVKLQFPIHFAAHCTSVRHERDKRVSFSSGWTNVWVEDDPYAATRRAIVRAAAEIGKQQDADRS